MLKKKAASFGSLIFIPILLVIVLVASCSSGTASGDSESLSAGETPLGRPSNRLIQTNAGGAVTIEVKWLVDRSEALVFDVVMDTHSVDLDRYDLSKLTVLRDSSGKEYGPIAWSSPPGGHHRQGILSFELPDSIKEGKSGYLEVIIRDVAGVKERVFKWETS